MGFKGAKFGELNVAKRPDVKLKLSIAAKKRYEDPAERQRAREINKQKWKNLTPEKRASWLKSMSECRKGKPLSELQLSRLREAKLGKPISKEHIAALVNSHKGKHISEDHKRKLLFSISGERNHFWNKPLPYEHRMKMIEAHIGGFWYGNVRYYNEKQYCEKFNPSFKQRVRAFWGYKCFNCGLPEELNIDRKGKQWDLTCHHIHFDKQMCCNDSSRHIVPICLSCHGETNHNKERWEEYYTDILYLISPTGKCYFERGEGLEFIKR